MNLRAITEADYDLILELDRKVYPTKSPVTKEIISSWYMRNPEFGMVYEKNGKVAGLCVVIPLNRKGWENLVEGKLSESQMSDTTIFDNQRDSEIGIHVYHIEKLCETDKFHQRSLVDLSGIVNILRSKNSNLRIAGFSGLCATVAGCNLFANTLNCEEGNYKNSEHIMAKGQKLVIVDTTEWSDIENKLKEGFDYVTRCKMLFTKPGEISPVWSYLN